MSLTIPLRNDLPHYSFQVELDGVTYGLEFLWNESAAAWFFNVLTAAGEVLAAGIRVVVDFPLGARFADARMPPGALVAQDTTGKRQDPAFEDLGARVIMLYFTAAETGG